MNTGGTASGRRFPGERDAGAPRKAGGSFLYLKGNAGSASPRLRAAARRRSKGQPGRERGGPQSSPRFRKLSSSQWVRSGGRARRSSSYFHPPTRLPRNHSSLAPFRLPRSPAEASPFPWQPSCHQSQPRSGGHVASAAALRRKHGGPGGCKI